MNTRSKTIVKKTTINDLPNEVLIIIFSHLPALCLRTRIPQVNSKWNSLSKDFALWKHIYLKAPLKLKKSAYNPYKSWNVLKWFIKTTPQLQNIIIKGHCPENEVQTLFQLIRKCSFNLRNIKIECTLEDPLLVFCLISKYLTNVEVLRVNVKDNVDVLNAICNIKNLTTLEIYRECPSPWFLEKLQETTDNSVNDLSLGFRITKIHFVNLLKYKNKYKRLSLNSSDLCHDCISQFNCLSNLQVLELIDSNLDVLKLNAISQLNSLCSLTLEELPGSAVLTYDMITDFFRGAYFPVLQTLRLFKIRLDDQGCLEIRRNCPDLRQLEVTPYPHEQSRMTDISLLHLLHCPRLRNLEIFFLHKEDWTFRRRCFLKHDCDINRGCKFDLEQLLSNWDEIYIPIM